MAHTKKRMSLQKKIVYLVTSVTLLMMSMILFFDTYSLRRSVEEAYVSQIRGMTNAINGRYEESRSVADVQQIFDYIQFKNDSVLLLTLYRSDGIVLASTDRGLIGTLNQTHMEDIRKEDITIIEREYNDQDGIPKVKMMAPLKEDGSTVGAIEVLINSSEQSRLVADRITFILLSGLIVAVVLVCLLFLIIHKIVIVPLMALRRAAVTVQQGGAHTELYLQASPEIEVLAAAFNEMVHNLEDRYDQLQQVLNTLKSTQAQLVQSEKMGALGSLVAGVSHEINTPIGIGVTAVSYLEEKTKEFVEVFRQNKMKKSDLDQFLGTVQETVEMVQSNLQRASELIRSFKQVSVDQSSEVKRTFNLKEYMEGVIVSLRPSLKKTRHRVHVHCDSSLEIFSYPGAISQIMTNFVMNSIIHAYEPEDEGRLVFNVTKSDKAIKLAYSDDGKGMPKEVVEKVFDPFFTTNRGKGGTGLGMNIVYNIVTGSLGGTIRCQSVVGKGTLFTIEFPIEEESFHE